MTLSTLSIDALIERLRNGTSPMENEPCTCGSDPEGFCPYCDAAIKIDATMREAANLIEKLR